MSLPNPDMSFTPFDPLPAGDLNDLVENIESLSGGTGFEDSSIGPSILNTGGTPATVNTSQNTTSTSPADLSTPGPSVTVNIGANGLALITVQASFSINTSTSAGTLYVVVSGSSTISAFPIASDRSPTATQSIILNGSFLLNGLTPGSNTFKLQYGVSGNTGTFSNRRLSVVPL